MTKEIQLAQFQS